MRCVIITGATGFVGANLARHVLHEGHEVHLLVRRGYAPWRIQAIRDQVRLHEVDLSNLQSLTRVVGSIRPEWVFHLAAYGAYSSQMDVQQMLQTNIIGTANLVQACLETGFEALINTGSSSEYGFKDHAPAETEWLDPNSYYALTKASATLFCRYTAQSKNVPITTLRLSSVYGPYEEPTRLMPTLILKGLRRELPPLVNHDIARDYVYVKDVNRAYLLAASIKEQELGAVYNVGTGIQTTLRQVVDVARRILDIGVEPKWGSMEDRSWDTDTWVSNSRHIQKVLGWRPQYDFEAGFREMVTWFCDNPAMLQVYHERKA